MKIKDGKNMEKCSAYVDNSCVNGYPDDVTARCGVCHGHIVGDDKLAYWTPCTDEGFFNSVYYPETGSPLFEAAYNKKLLTDIK